KKNGRGYQPASTPSSAPTWKPASRRPIVPAATHNPCHSDQASPSVGRGSAGCPIFRVLCERACPERSRKVGFHQSQPTGFRLTSPATTAPPSPSSFSARCPSNHLKTKKACT